MDDRQIGRQINDRQADRQIDDRYRHMYAQKKDEMLCISKH